VVGEVVDVVVIDVAGELAVVAGDFAVAGEVEVAAGDFADAGDGELFAEVCA
jgi:hypothetical protein